MLCPAFCLEPAPPGRWNRFRRRMLLLSPPQLGAFVHLDLSWLNVTTRWTGCLSSFWPPTCPQFACPVIRPAVPDATLAVGFFRRRDLGPRVA